VKRRTYRTEGIILKRVNFGEADRILTVLTKHQGKIHCLAKGVRKLTSRKAASLELFNLAVIFLAKGKSLDIVTEAKIIKSFPVVRQSLGKIAAGYQVCEVVDKLTPLEQKDEEVYFLLTKALEEIDQHRFTPRRLLRFKIELLGLTGFGAPQKSSLAVDQYIEEIIEKKINSNSLLKKIIEER